MPKGLLFLFFQRHGAGGLVFLIRIFSDLILKKSCRIRLKAATITVPLENEKTGLKSNFAFFCQYVEMTDVAR